MDKTIANVEKMEDIKTNFDKIMSKFNDSIVHTAPKKLFEKSQNEPVIGPKKRRMSSHDEEHAGQLNSSTETPNVSSSSLNTSNSVPPSPWETRRMKADLIEAKTRINKLKFEIEKLHKVRNEMEAMYQSKVSELVKQSDFSSQKVEDLEKHVQALRKREQSAKQESIKYQKELNQLKSSSEEAMHQLKKEKRGIEEHAQYVQSCLSNEISEYRRLSDKLQTELELVRAEFNKVKDQMQEYKARASSYDELLLKHEKEHQDLVMANSRIKELEFQIDSYNDWKEITKNSQARLQSIPELTKENTRLKANNKHLHDLLGNKLLLEEQVHDLKTRLEKEEASKNEAVALQVKLSSMEQELKEWVKVAQDHCLPNMLVSPIALRSRIEQLLQNDIVMASEKSASRSETKSLESELHDYKMKADLYAKNVEELSGKLKNHKYFKERLQRKLILVSRERDFFKQLVDNYEKDLTISNTSSDTVNPEVLQLRLRLEMVEKTLVGYKEMCGNLERELSNAHNMPNMEQQTGAELQAAETLDNLKRELDKLRMDNEHLRRRKEELELELEHHCLKGDFNVDKYKILHMANNPAADAYAKAENLVEKLQAEIERLKRRIKKLEDDKAELTQARTTEETTNLTMNIKEANQLRGELEALNTKYQKMRDVYKSLNLELRDVCYMLFGYRIDVGKNKDYKLSSMYAESPDDYLNFHLNESNVLTMLETPYSDTLRTLVETHLVGNKSLPAFLSTLTLELFQRATITIS